MNGSAQRPTPATDTGVRWTVIDWPEREVPHISLLPPQAGDVELWAQAAQRARIVALLLPTGILLSAMRLDEVHIRTEDREGKYETYKVRALVMCATMPA